jgi:hypothetical protein
MILRMIGWIRGSTEPDGSRFRVRYGIIDAGRRLKLQAMLDVKLDFDSEPGNQAPMNNGCDTMCRSQPNEACSVPTVSIASCASYFTMKFQ